MTHLVVQAPTLADSALGDVVQLVDPRRDVEVAPNAYRLTDVKDDPATRAAVQAYCDEAAIDWAFVPPGMRLADWKILAMDMDSTLINIECIDEIADFAGLRAQVAAITEAAMRGEIKDFAESLRRRVALLKGVPVDALQQVYIERLKLNPGAERLVLTAHRFGLKTLLVSGGFTWFTSRILQRLQLNAAHSNTLVVENGRLTGEVEGAIVDADGKAMHLKEFARHYDVPVSSAIAIGDGANDLKMLGLAGIGVAYHAKPIVRQQTTYALNACGLDGVLNWFEDTAGHVLP